jgi:hypothetical protein
LHNATKKGKLKMKNVYLVRKGVSWFIGQTLQTVGFLQSAPVLALTDVFVVEFLTGAIPNRLDPRQPQIATTTNIYPLAETLCIYNLDAITAELQSGSPIYDVYVSSLAKMKAGLGQKGKVQ